MYCSETVSEEKIAHVIIVGMHSFLIADYENEVSSHSNQLFS